MDRTLIENLIRSHEGIRNTVYRDTEGNLTIGVGFNLDSPAAKTICSGLGIDHDAVCNGQALTNDQVEELFQGDVNAALFAARCQLTNFDELPDEAQAVVVDMVFNVGSTKFAGFVKFKAALSQDPPDFWTAAAEARDSLWCGQVKTRCDDNVGILEAL